MGKLRETWNRWMGNDSMSAEEKRRKEREKKRREAARIKKRRAHFKKAKSINAGGYEYKQALEEADDY